jgi:hypothetical protein
LLHAHLREKRTRGDLVLKKERAKYIDETSRTTKSYDMPPKEGTSTCQDMKKPLSKQGSNASHKKKPSEAIDLFNFPRAYVPPRKTTTKQVILQKEAKYDMVTLVIPPKCHS